MLESSSYSAQRHGEGWRTAALVAGAILLLAAVFALAPAEPAFAGKAASGELLFYPCTDCHPLTPGSVSGLPNDFPKHEITLEGHDNLGTGREACFACHDLPSNNPGMLWLVDGTQVEITGDVSQVCYQCHYQKYDEFLAGMHGPNQEKCTDSGCHDPHTPGHFYAEPLLPFVGTGFQFQVLPVSVPFTPLAAPGPAPAYHTPTWFIFLVALVLIVVASQIYMLVARGRQSR